MSSLTNEKAFEELIEQSLITQGGYIKGDPAQFNRELALDTATLFNFIKDTTPVRLNQMSRRYFC